MSKKGPPINVHVGRWRIYGDWRDFTVVEEVAYRKDGKEKVRQADPRYFPTMQSAVKNVVRRMVADDRRAPVTTLREYVERMEEAEKRVEDLVGTKGDSR